MKNFKTLIILLIPFFCFLFAENVFAASDIQPAAVYDGLTEVFARKSYSNVKPLSFLYSSNIIQPETLHFNDTEYGTHVWRISDSFDSFTFAHNHINRSPWNANGSKLGLISNRCFLGLWCRTNEAPGDPHIFLVDTNGDNFQRVVASNCPSCTADGTRFRFWVWDRNNPNFAYFAAKDGLYRLNASQLGSFTKVASLPNTDRSKVVYSYISESNVVMVNDDFANSYPDPMFYFVNVDTGAVNSFPIAFNLNNANHDLAKEKSFHDIYFTRRSDDSFGFNYGPTSGVGEYLFFLAPISGDPAQVTVWFDNYGTNSIPYHSHPAWGPNGQNTSYFGEKYPSGSNVWGWQVANDATGQNVKMLGRYDGSNFSGGHIAWDGYDPDFLFAASNNKMYKATLSGAENNFQMFLNTYTGLNDSTDGYQTSPRPAQSPDGTKVFYHSSMTEKADSSVDGFVAVARYPAPAQNVRLSGSSIVWDPPTFHRETKGYHVYRSAGGTASFSEITSEAISATSFSLSGLQAGTDYYYAVTTEEWSGLESNELSNIVKINYQNNSYSSSSHSGQGTKNFDKTTPPMVARLVSTSVSSGIYRLNWQATSATDVWYYNIYYSVEGSPSAVPARLVASVPKSKTTFVDWRARTDAPGFYAVTAVDRQGNESSLVANINVAQSPGPDEEPVANPVATDNTVQTSTTSTTQTTTTTSSPSTSSSSGSSGGGGSSSGTSNTPVSASSGNTTSATAPLGTLLTKTISIGSEGAEVVALQKFLISQNYLTTTSPLGYYGELTRAAVKKFQCAKSIACSGNEASTGFGMVGQKTRAAINTYYGGSSVSGATSREQLLTLLAALLKQVAELQAKLQTMKASGSPS